MAGSGGVWGSCRSLWWPLLQQLGWVRPYSPYACNTHQHCSSRKLRKSACLPTSQAGWVRCPSCAALQVWRLQVCCVLQPHLPDGALEVWPQAGVRAARESSSRRQSRKVEKYECAAICVLTVPEPGCNRPASQLLPRQVPCRLLPSALYYTGSIDSDPAACSECFTHVSDMYEPL